MAGPGRLDILRVLFQVEIHRSLQSELAVFNNDRVFVLGNTIDRAIERPIKDDARRLATKTRIILALEIRCSLFTCFCQFATAIQARSRSTTSSSAATASRIGWPLALFVLTQLV